MASDQFDLEQEIMRCWNITGDINDLLEEVIEGEPTTDEISNVLLGLHELYEIKFRKLFRTFEGFLKTYYDLRNQVKASEDKLFVLNMELTAAKEEIARLKQPAKTVTKKATKKVARK